jgi:hypothetical protein
MVVGGGEGSKLAINEVVDGSVSQTNDNVEVSE